MGGTTSPFPVIPLIFDLPANDHTLSNRPFVKLLDIFYHVE